MKLRLISWNSQNINDSNPYSSYILPGQLASLSVSPVIVNRANEYPAITTVVKQPSTLIIGVVIAPGQNINTYRETLKKYFFNDHLRHNIIAEDENDSNRQYYRTGFPIQLRQESETKPNSFFITIQTEYPYWQLVTPSSDSWDITASGDSDVINNIGNIPVAPVFTITPTTTKTSGYKYWRYVPIYNNLDKAINLPFDVTNGGLDVQTLIDAGKMQANGNDFRIWNNGSFTDRWLYGMDSDSDPAKAWVNMNIPAKHEALINASIDSDDTTLSFGQTESNLSFLEFLTSANNYTLLIENEAVTFDPVNIDTILYRITGIERAQKNTTADAHTSGVYVRYIGNDLFIMYGDSDATAPDTNDLLKPIFDLSSTNAMWRYTNYYDNLSPRPGAWKPELKASRTKLSYYFTDNNNAFINPADVLGLAERNSSDYTAGHETALIAWSFSSPVGITNVSYSGEKYKTSSWPGIVGLQKLQTNLAWFTVYNEETPTVASSWETFGPRSESLSGTYENIRFAIDGTLSSTVNEAAMVQFDSVEITFDSDNIPSISVGAETSINFFDFTLTNSTTGEYIRCQTPCPLNSPLVIDCVNKKAYLADGKTVPVILSSQRDNWLDLQPGNNSLVYSDTGTVAVTIMTEHRDKVL